MQGHCPGGRPGDFSRAGGLSPSLLVTLLLYMAGDANRRGYTRLIEAFWDECRSFDIPLPFTDAVSGSAFCQARAKLSNRFMRAIAHRLEDAYEGRFPSLARWRGLRVFAVDGSRHNIQRSDELRRRFGVPDGAHCPQVLISMLINVISEAPTDVVVAPYATSERALLLQHLDRLRPADVLVLDRGYPSFDILQLLIERGIDFVIRVPSKNTFGAIDAFVASGSNDYRLQIEPPANSKPGSQPIDVRAVRTWSPEDDTIVFLTSLRRCDITTMQVRELYRLRWRIEESFKLVKSNYLGQRQLHAKNFHGVVQEILALTLFVAVSRFVAAAAAAEHGVQYDHLSIKAVILSVATYLTRLVLCTDEAHANRWLLALLRRVASAREKRRPGRSSPRRSFKPSARWGPRGRRGAS